LANGKLSYNPLYLQVKDIIQKQVVDGKYPPGANIPSEARLAEDFGTSVSTIRQALSILVSEGKLVKKQGRGTFVSEQKVEITLFSWIGETPRGEEILRQTIEAFERKNPAIHVTVIPTEYLHARDDLLRLITNGKAPDVAQIVSPWTTYYSSMGAFEPMEDLLSTENIGGRFEDKDLSGGRYLNKLYSVAWGLCPLSLIVNKNCLRDLGLEQLDTPMTLEQFSKICLRASGEYGENDKYAYGINLLHDETDFFRIYTFLQAFGGGFVNAEGEVIFNSRENASGFTWLKNFVTTTKILKTDIYTIRKEFAQNKVLFMTDGPWINYMMEEETGEPFENNFDVVLNPTFSANVSLSWNYNHALAICAQSRNKMHAARFIDSVTVEPDVGGLYYQLSGHLPLNERQRTQSGYDRPNFKAFWRQLENSECLNAENSMFEKAMVLCMDAVQKIFFDGVNVKDELDEKQYYLKMLYYG
jgi:ABC-type glycerol-3-phosphate transport system substrate-binding protein